MNTTLIKSALSLVGKYCLYSTLLDGIKLKERYKMQAELEKLKIENAKLEATTELQQKIIDILEGKTEKETTEEQ